MIRTELKFNTNLKKKLTKALAKSLHGHLLSARLFQNKDLLEIFRFFAKTTGKRVI